MTIDRPFEKLKKVFILLTMVTIVSIFFAINAYADNATVKITVPSGYDTDKLGIELDGVPVALSPTENEREYEVTVKPSSKFITAIRYNRETTDPNCYPVGMAVWEVIKRVTQESPEGGGFSGSTGQAGEPETVEITRYSVRRLEGFDNILGYEGFAIKPPTQEKSGGIRCSLSILTDIKENGLKNDDNITEYSVEEYGHLHILSRNWNSGSKKHMTLEDQLVLKASCYVRGGADHVLRIDGDKTVFANSLYDIADYNVNKYFRGYIKLHKASTNEDVYLYGPIVGRNPYYVAKKAAENASESLEIRNFARDVIIAVEGDPSNPPDPSNPTRTYSAYFIGDSIMMGMTIKDGVNIEHGPSKPSDYKQVSRQPSVQIGKRLASRLNARVDCTLVANGGATYSEPGANLYNMPDLADIAIDTATSQGRDPDFIFLMAGVNDWAYKNQGEGLHEDTAVFGENGNGSGFVTNEFGVTYYPADKTYCIGVDRTIKKLVNEYPDAEIMVCSPLRAWWISGPGTITKNLSTGKVLDEYCYVQESVSNYYKNTLGKNVHFINLYDDILDPMGLPNRNHDPNADPTPEKHANFKRYFPDGYHPNQAGYDVICGKDNDDGTVTWGVIIDDMTALGIIPAAN